MYRHSRTCQRHSANALHQKGSSEPWLLVTNILTDVMNGVQITRRYAKRMQIEEAFRDLKSTAYGMALRHNRTRCVKRVNILLLIALLADILMWWNGLVATQAGCHYHFQANTIKHRRVLSIPRLDREARKTHEHPRHERLPSTVAKYSWSIAHIIRLR